MAIHKTSQMKYEVLEECGVLSRSGKWEMKLRYISWKDREPRYDLRRWTKDEDGNEKCGKGATLTGEELMKLHELLAEMAGDEE